MKKKGKSVLQRLLPYGGKKKCLLFIAMVCSALSGIMLLMPMVYIHRIIQNLVLQTTTDPARVGSYAASAAAFAIAGLVLYFIALMASHLLAFEVEENIVKINLRKLLAKPLGFFANRESGKLRATIVNGAAETHSFLAHQLPDLAMTMVSPLVLIVFFILFDWRLGLASAFSLIVGIMLMATMMSKKGKKLRSEYYGDLANISAEAVEYVRGIPVVKTFAQSVESFERLYSLIIRLKDKVMDMTMGWKNKMALFEAVSSSTAFFLVPAAILLFADGADVREVLANSIIYLLIGPALGVFSMRSAAIGQYAYFAQLALDRIDDCMGYDDLSYGSTTEGGSGLEFKNVSFSYGDEKVLDDISFTVNTGETVALVGASGGGKTTVARLAARFYDAAEGEVCIGGVNIKDYEKTALMKKIAFVFQKSNLFKMSLRDNLLLGNPKASNEEIERALLQSGSKEIVERLKDGLDTEYGKKGTYFSGGEVQRLIIARALLKDAEFVILDEATAFADPENEQIIQESFKELSKNKTTLMIAHRLSTVVTADKILVIDQGKIAESGTHQELLGQGGLYKKLWDEYQQAANWKIGGRHE